MASSNDSGASSAKRTACLDRQGHKYTLVLWENGTPVTTEIIDSEEDKIAVLKWQNNMGVGFPGATYSMVTKGSSFEFEGNLYIVEKDTPFETTSRNVAPDIERLIPLMTALPDLFREVGISRKSRLNCWERESLRTSSSKRSKKFRRKVIDYYKRASNSGKKVKCQILDHYILKNEAEDEATGIIAAHIWKASTRGRGLEDFGLRPEDVNIARNGLFLTKGLEDALDNQQICFLYNLLEKKIVLWVADISLMNKTIDGSGKTSTDGSDLKFSDVHERPLLCPPDRFPFRRLLSWHARLTLELRPQTVDPEQFTSAYDNSPGRENAVIDPIARAISRLVEPGDDAST